MTFQHVATDLEKGESKEGVNEAVYEVSVEGNEVPQAFDLAHFDYTPAENKKVVFKLDIHILPFIFMGYLFQSLDRGNVSNAKSDGMTTDLNFPDNGYAVMLSVFYLPFSLLVVPGVWLTRTVGAKWTIPGYMIGWGAMCLINTACKNFGEVLAVRLLLGAFEAGYSASLIYYLGTFYTRGELGTRVAVFYTCLSLSGAFSGLIAFGVFQLKSSLQGWQILFLIEGAFTIAYAVVMFVCLPWSIDSAGFLDERARVVARQRLLQDGTADLDAKFSWPAFFKPLRSWQYYVLASIALCYGIASSVSSNFLTQIIGRFHFSVVKTNLYTVAPFVCGAVALLVTAMSSDHFRERGLHLASSFAFVIVGCVLLVALPVTSIGACYFATFLITCGAFTPSVLFHTWHQCNDPTLDGRAFRVGSYTLLANLGGIVSANIFKEEWAPAYRIPLAFTAGVEALGLVLVIFMRMWMWNDNRRRNKEQGVNLQSKDVPTEALADGPSNPAFRYFY